MRYYKEQMPVEPLLITVVDERGKPRSLSAYTSAELLIADPRSIRFDDAGTAAITDAPNGKVTFTWSGQSVFGITGRYSMQLKLINGTRYDYADVGEFDVLEALDE